MAKVIRFGGTSELRSYLTPSRSSILHLLVMLSRDRRPCHGLVFDPSNPHWGRQAAELIATCKPLEIETILDTRSLELAAPTAWARPAMAKLTWRMSQVHDEEALGDFSFRKTMLTSIASFVMENAMSGVLAPTHFINDVNDRWLELDDLLVNELRRELDQLGGEHVVLYRPLYIHSHLLRDIPEIERVATRFKGSAADGIWLAVHPFGASSARPLALRHYVAACRALHKTGLPVIAARTGTVGLLLLAIGAVGGIESGITDGENFSIERRTRGLLPRKEGQTVTGSLPRVYVPSLGVFLTTKEANAFFAKRGMKSQHACQGECCPRGFADMLERRIPHFLFSRAREIEWLSQTPIHRRPAVYRDDFLRPASDHALAASRVDERMERARNRLDDWRIAVEWQMEHDGGRKVTHSPEPTGRRLRHTRGA